MKIEAPFSADTLRRQLQGRAATRWLVGFSGGLDSTALLAALIAARPSQPIIAIHVNHGLNPAADEWQARCQAFCERHDVVFIAEQVKVQVAGKGIEDAARQTRYRALMSHMRTGDVLLLGHHQDDQAETLLFRLLRGTGPRGLAAMARERPFGPGRLLRPLLHVSREALEEFARQANLAWVEDPSNRDASLDRNYLRHRVMPLLRERWPGFEARWLATTAACAEAEQLNRDLAKLDLTACEEREERLGWSLARGRLASLADYRRRNVLRQWLSLRGCPPLQRRQLAELERQFFSNEEPSAGACLQWSDAALRIYRERLYLLPGDLPVQGNPVHRNAPIPWQLPEALQLPDGSRLSVSPAREGLRMPAGEIEIRWRRGGERCRPAGRVHSQSLKKLFQEYGLEPWLRERVPLIYLDGQLAAVGDLWICAGFTAREGEPACQLHWRPATDP